MVSLFCFTDKDYMLIVIQNPGEWGDSVGKVSLNEMDFIYFIPRECCYNACVLCERMIFFK